MADPLNPTVPGVSVSPYPPELQQEASALARRRAIADMLMLRAFQPVHQPTGPNGIPVPMSPFAALMPVAGAFLGMKAQSGADEAAQGLAQKYSTGIAGARAKMFDLIKQGKYDEAAQVAGPYPALSQISEVLAARTLPKNEITTTYDPQGRPQPSAVNVNAPQPTVTPIGGPKPPEFHPYETTLPGSPLPATGFYDPTKPPLAPQPKPVRLAAENLGGTTQLSIPYGPERTLPHTIDPNRVPTNEDIEAAAKRIEEYRAPGFATSGGRAQPWQMNVMKRVDEIAASKGRVYDSSVFPIVQSAEREFNEKNAPVIRSFGTLIGHVDAAKQLFKALDNPSDVRKVNQARNYFLEEFGYPAPTNVDVAKQFIADESVKAVLGAPGALDDRKAMAEKLSRASSPAQFETDANTVIHFGVENMKSHLQQLKGMTKGKRAEEDFVQYLTPAARQAFLQYGGVERRKGVQEGIATPPPLLGAVPQGSGNIIDFNSLPK